MTVELHLGDCLDIMRSIPDKSVDAVITDPPYELGFMGKAWDNTGIANNKDMWREVLRVLKPGGHLLSFGGTRTYHRMACAIEDAGFEIRDQIQWIYGSGFPKSLNIGKVADEWDGWGTALKPANEPIVLARKPIEEKTVASNVLKWGTGGINIDGCRVGFQGEEDYLESTHKNRHADFNSNNGIRVPTKGIYHGDNRPPINYTPTTGRFPANVIHDGSDEVVELFPQSNGEMHNKMSSGNSMFLPDNEGAKRGYSIKDPGSAARFFYCAKASRSERNAGLEGTELHTWKEQGFRDNESTHLSPRAGAGRLSPMQNFHPTVKPIALMRYLCRLITPPGGTVLDPFMGSGTTGCAAELEGFNFIGIEQNPEYFAIAEKRIHDAQQQMRLPI